MKTWTIGIFGLLVLAAGYFCRADLGVKTNTAEAATLSAMCCGGR